MAQRFNAVTVVNSVCSYFKVEPPNDPVVSEEEVVDWALSAVDVDEWDVLEQELVDLGCTGVYTEMSMRLGERGL